MKMLVGVTVIVLAIIAMRLTIQFLLVPAQPVMEPGFTATEKRALNNIQLPSNSREEQVLVQDERLDLGYKPKPVKHLLAAEPEKPKLLVEPIAVVEETPLTPDQVLPEVAGLLSSGFKGSEEQRRLELARFVQSVAPSIVEIDASLSALQSMQLPVEKQQAYVALAQEKVAALTALKQRALNRYPDLMSLSTE